MEDSVSILVADDEEDFRIIFSDILKKMGYQVRTVQNGLEAISVIENQPVDIALIDFKMPGMSGIELLKEIKLRTPQIEVIVITGMGTIDSAVEAMKSGAYDYITKPVNFEELESILRRIVHTQSLIKENQFLKETIRQKYKFQNLIGATPRMQEIFEIIEKVSKNRSTVLIQGENGTGKELIARAVHFNGPLAEKPFMPVDCSAIPENLVESELFGHEKGSFTGAIYSKKGLFRLAQGGTVFLDEIEELPREVQPKLLRALQERQVKPVGGSKYVPIEVRVIAAANQDLGMAVAKGKFREDLFYRLNVVQIDVPPLRERRDDIPVLVKHFIEKYREKQKDLKIKRVSPEVLRIFMTYHWPGNVRELENVIERAFALESGESIQVSDLPDYLLKQVPKTIENPTTALRSLEEIEKEAIERTLNALDGDRTRTAQILKIDRTTLYRKMKRYGLS
ncbi:transcriptional regulatory protein ZraR [bacterium BMS3Abin05]|nr:transcriptional regulatory protein ZraR [bacterium BMS3Abin05]GBE28558.1 transcriptional regulatory protein ZraR [bacterium BMS3Bbin03]HDL78401.1 sigma-54-dependent Fis family transcriptional regulator [Bacteroidota bacterium]HDZ12346.1 sigma-54-dependent Fis family transcriptional regulator [Bacteroidota bacterium]